MTVLTIRALSARIRHFCAALPARAAALLCALGLVAPTAALVVSTGKPSPALAQEAFGLNKTESSQPMLLQADEMIYDNQNNRVIARGNVEIYYGNYTLLADSVVYDRAAHTLTAEGNVRIKEPDGALINADHFTLTDDFRDGFLRSLKIVTVDDSRIAAERAYREGGDTTIFEQGAFTPCKPCEERPEKPPTWRVKAERVIHKKSEATIEYENAAFELFGVPIVWMPFFKHADPSVKRRSGFLIPSIGGSSESGTIVEIPYYFALAPNYDFTFSPAIVEKRGILLKGNWRHRTENGKYNVDVAGIFQTFDDKPIGYLDEDFRGSIKTQGLFNINAWWHWGWDVTAETDDTFRRYYDLDSILLSDRVSEVFLEGQKDRNYFSARLYHLGGLLATDTAISESVVHPVIDYSYFFKNPILGGELSFNTNVLSLSADNAPDSTRLISELKWRRMMIDRHGQVFTPFWQARGDVYKVSNVVDPITQIRSDEDALTRGMAVGGIEYRYPWVRHGANASHVLEPIAQIIARPDVSNQFDVPNEDARSLVFDDTLLFDIDKFSGYDRIETGTRANVGIRYTLQSVYGGYVRAVFGQSYQIAGDNSFAAGTGLATSTSDYVAGLYVQPTQYLSLISQARFDEDTFDVRRLDLGGNAAYGPISGSVVYTNLEAQPAQGIFNDRQEITTGGVLKLTDNWSMLGNIRFDLERQERLTDSIGLRWADDCFAITLYYDETFIRDRDIEPEQKLMLRFELKHLGAFDIDAGTF
ncbi:MAG: LPS-assembly protein LptD [Hyphomicrobiales bacterium]